MVRDDCKGEVPLDFFFPMFSLSTVSGDQVTRCVLVSDASNSSLSTGGGWDASPVGEGGGEEQVNVIVWLP